MDIISITFYSKKNREFPPMSTLIDSFSKWYPVNKESRIQVLKYFDPFFEGSIEIIEPRVVSVGTNTKYYFLLLRDYGKEIRLLISPTKEYDTLNEYIATANYNLRTVSSGLKKNGSYYSAGCKIETSEFRPVHLGYERRRRAIPKELLGQSGLLILLTSYVSIIMAQLIGVSFFLGEEDNLASSAAHSWFRIIFGLVIAILVNSLFLLVKYTLMNKKQFIRSELIN